MKKNSWIVLGIVIIIGVAGFYAKKDKNQEVVDPNKVVEVITWEGELIGEDPATKVAREIREEFDRTHPHIKVIRRTKPAGQERKVFATAMAGGTGPDLAEIPGVDTRTYIEQGFVADLTDFLKEWGELENLYPNMLEPVKKDGRYYGLPREYYVMLLAYRTDLYEKAGLDSQKPPQTWEEFGKYGNKLTNRAKNQYGFGIRGDDLCAFHFIDYVWQAGGDFMRVDPKTKKMIATFVEKPAIIALSFYQDLRWKYNMVQSNVLQGRKELVNDFVSGRSAMFKFYAQDMSELVAAGLTPEQIGLAPLPKGPTGVQVSQMAPKVYVINATTNKEKQRAAFEYIKYLISKETMVNRWKLEEKYGILAPTTPIWKGMLQSDSVDIPAEWSAAIEQQSKYARPEPFFPYWDKVKQYLIQPIQAVLLNPKVDPASEMKKCAVKVQREIFDVVGPIE